MTTMQIDIPAGYTVEQVRSAIDAALAKMAKPKPSKRGAEVGTVGALLAALRNVADAAPTHSRDPVLTGAHIKICAGVAVISCTDLEIHSAVTIATPGAPDGAWVTPVKALIAALRTMPAHKPVSITTAQHGALIINGTVMGYLKPTDWPSMKCDFTGAFQLSIDADRLARLLSTCRHAISTEQTRYYLNGIALQARSGSLVAVATDGHRLAKTSLPIDCAGMPDIIIPAPMVSAMIAACKTTPPVRVEILDTHIRLTAGDIVVTSKLIDGAFPDYERVIPRDFETNAEVQSSDLANAVKCAMVAAPKPLQPIKMEIDTGRLTVTGRDAETGAHATADLDCTGTIAPVGFQSRYLLDMIAATGAEHLEISGNNGGPHRFRVPGDTETVFVIMPVRV